jgi:ribosomal protein S18 acetylase RimI-like enzyme
MIGTPSRYSTRYMLASKAPTTLPKGSYFFVLKHEREILGSAIAELYGNGYTLRIVEIREDMRGKGFGKLLVSQILTFLKLKGKEIRLYVDPTNKPAVSLYTKLGFKRIKHTAAFGDKYVHA